MADHNWIPLATSRYELIRLGQELMGETDEERWAAGLGLRHGLEAPRGTLVHRHLEHGHRRIRGRSSQRLTPSIRVHRGDVLEVARDQTSRRASSGHCSTRATRRPGGRVQDEVFGAFPTNWGLPRAGVTERTCAAKGADACLWRCGGETPGSGVISGSRPRPAAWTIRLARGAGLCRGIGPGLGRGRLPGARGRASPPASALREARRRRHTRRLLDLQSEEIMLLQQRARGEVPGSRGQDRAAVAAHRAVRRGQRHPRAGEDLRAGARPARPPHGLSGRLPLPRRSRAQAPSAIGHDVAGAADTRGRRRPPSRCGVPARPGRERREQGRGHRRARPRQRHGRHGRAGPSRHRRAPRVSRAPERAPPREEAGVRRALAECVRAGALRRQ